MEQPWWREPGVTGEASPWMIVYPAGGKSAIEKNRRAGNEPGAGPEDLDAKLSKFLAAMQTLTSDMEEEPTPAPPRELPANEPTGFWDALGRMTKLGRYFSEDEARQDRVREENARTQSGYQDALLRAVEKRNANRRQIAEPIASRLFDVIFAGEKKAPTTSAFEQKLAAMRQAPWFSNLPPEKQAELEQDLFRGYREPSGPSTAANVQMARFLASPEFQSLPKATQDLITGTVARRGGAGPGAAVKTPAEQAFFDKMYGWHLQQGETPEEALDGATQALDGYRQSRDLFEPETPPEDMGGEDIDEGGEPTPYGAGMGYPLLPETMNRPDVQNQLNGVVDTQNLEALAKGYQRLIEMYPSQRDDARREFMRKYGQDPEAILSSGR